MKLFQCQNCGQVLYFENTACLNCGFSLGYLPGEDRMAAVEADGPLWRAVAPQGQTEAETRRWRFCRNWELSACNWMVPAEDSQEADAYCTACQHNRTVPDLSDPDRHARWQRIEAAKRRLIYTLMRLGLPRPHPGTGDPEPLIFDFLDDGPNGDKKVMTGHDRGIVTLSLAEADDSAREKTRSEMGEAYRTLLGHFRHEIGHYYWDRLVREGGALEAFRAMFGDERADYTAALERHYRDGPPAGWENAYVSAYATMHPWEDWAETWAHYLHMVDTLETASTLRISVEPAMAGSGNLWTEIDFDPYAPRDAERLLSAWMPLTVALNMLNRSMGQRDLYPFSLPDQVQRKIAFVHDLVAGWRAAA